MRAVVAFAFVCAVVCVAAADTTPFNLLGFAAQRWQLKASFAQGQASVAAENATELLLARSFHFANQLTGECTIADTPLHFRLEGRDDTTATLHIGVATRSAADAAQDADATGPTPLATLRIAVRDIGVGASRVATGTYRMLEGTLPAAVAPAGASALLSAKTGGFQLTIASADTFVLSFTAGPPDSASASAPFLTVTGAGDAAPPAQPWWQRFGPSGAMFALFFAMRIFQGFVDNRNEQKEVLRRTMAARSAAKGAAK